MRTRGYYIHQGTKNIITWHRVRMIKLWLISRPLTAYAQFGREWVFLNQVSVCGLWFIPQNYPCLISSILLIEVAMFWWCLPISAKVKLSNAFVSNVEFWTSPVLVRSKRLIFSNAQLPLLFKNRRKPVQVFPWYNSQENPQPYLNRAIVNAV